MRCSEFEKHIGEYLDGSHQKSLRRRMENHSAVCPACARLLAIQTSIAGMLDSAGQIAAPSGLAGRILAAAEREYLPAPSFRLRPALISAAVFVIVTGIQFFIAGKGEADIALETFFPNLSGWPASITPWLTSFVEHAGLEIAGRPIVLPFLTGAVPLYCVLAYVVFMGLLIWYAEDCFPPMSSFSAANSGPHRNNG